MTQEKPELSEAMRRAQTPHPELVKEEAQNLAALLTSRSKRNYEAISELAIEIERTLPDGGNCMANARQLFALKNIIAKIARLVDAGGQDLDSWRDLAGYAILGAAATIQDNIRDNTQEPAVPLSPVKQTDDDTYLVMVDNEWMLAVEEDAHQRQEVSLDDSGWPKQWKLEENRATAVSRKIAVKLKASLGNYFPMSQKIEIRELPHWYKEGETAHTQTLIWPRKGSIDAAE